MKRSTKTTVVLALCAGVAFPAAFVGLALHIAQAMADGACVHKGRLISGQESPVAFAGHIVFLSLAALTAVACSGAAVYVFVISRGEDTRIDRYLAKRGREAASTIASSSSMPAIERPTDS